MLIKTIDLILHYIDNETTTNTINPKQKTSIREYASQYRKSRYFYPSIAISLFAFVAIYLKPLLVTTFFIIATFISLMHTKYHRFHLGLEVGTFGIVITSTLYGPYYGALIGFIAYPLSIVYSDDTLEYSPIIFISVILIALIASSIEITAANILLWGIIITWTYDLITGYLYYHTYETPLIDCITYTITHTWINYILFSSVGALALTILG